MAQHRNRLLPFNKTLQRQYIRNFVNTMYDGDLHAKRVLSLANATLGVLTSASLAIHAVGRGFAQAMGTLTKHGVKQVDRLLSNQGIDVWTYFAYWVPYIVGARTEGGRRGGLDELCGGRPGHDCIVYVDGPRARHTTAVEDGEVVDVEG